MRFTSSFEKDLSFATFDEVTKSTRGINTMSRVVKRKIQKIKPVAAIEIQSCIGVLACTRVPLVDNKWTQLPKDLKEQILEAVQMAYVVGEGGKKMVLSSATKKWKDFKSTLTRQFILPFANEKEKLKEPPQLYNFVDKSEWDGFVDKSEREVYLNLLSKIPTTPITPIPPIHQEQSPKNPITYHVGFVDLLESFILLHVQTIFYFFIYFMLQDLSKLDMPAPLLVLCQYAETKLKPANETIRIHMPEEIVLLP
ncbi:unnamed protein product [Prunus brigantina]